MLDEAKIKMDKAIGYLKGELAQIRTGRATATLVENVKVTVYSDQQLTVKELATIATSGPNQLLVIPWDKTIVGDLAGQINKANLGLTAVADGEQIRIIVPPLTAERREEFTKLLHKTLEKFRVEIRQVRQETMQDLKEKKDSSEIGEDEKMHLEKKLQELVDEKIEEIDQLGEKKETELLEL